MAEPIAKDLPQNIENAEPKEGVSTSIDLDREAAERRLRTKIDWMVMPTVCLLYLFCFIDRANIGNARIAGLEADLNMAGYDYNILLTLFYVSYIVFEIPSNILCKIVGPGWFIPTVTVLFGICSLGTAWVQNLEQAMAVRFLLGAFESGMMPGIAYYLSRWYRRAELTFRLSMYIVMGSLAGAFGGLLASGILTLDSFGNLRTWRMIFAIEGMITIILGLIGFFTLTDRPETARWLTEEEKKLAEERIRSERVVQGGQVLDRLDKKKFLRGILNPVTLSNSLLFLFDNITVQGLAVFAPTIVRSIYSDRTTIQQQLFTVPPYVLGSIFTLTYSYLSWRTDRRQIFIILAAPLVMVGYVMFLASDNATVRYAGTFLIASTIFSLGSLTNSQVSANVVSDTARASAIATNVMFGNVGGLISTWSFLPWDGPDYPIGNGLNLATTGCILIVSILTYIWMKRDNASRAANEEQGLEEIAGMTPEEQEDLDWRHPSFRWRI